MKHLPHWQSPRHPPHLCWPHLQRGLRHFHLMLLMSGQIPHIHWLGTMLGPATGPTTTSRPRTWAWRAWQAGGTSSWSTIGHWAPARRGRTGLWVVQRGRPGMIALGWRTCCRRRGGGNALLGEFTSTSPSPFGCCGSGSRWTCAHCRSCITSCTLEDSLLQHIFGLPVTVGWWGMHKIQAMEPQLGPLSINVGHQPCDNGWSALVCEVCWKGGECVQEMEHNSEAST